MSLLNITNLPMSLANLKLKFSPLIVLMISKSIWKKVLNLLLALYTLFQHLNKKLSRNSLRKTSIQVLSNQSPLYIMYWSYLSRRKIVYYASVLTSMILITFPKKISIQSTKLTSQSLGLFKDRSLPCLSFGLYHWQWWMEDCF